MSSRASRPHPVARLGIPATPDGPVTLQRPVTVTEPSPSTAPRAAGLARLRPAPLRLLGGPVTTTVAGVDAAIVRTFAGIRLVVLAQAGIMVCFKVEAAMRPWLAVTTYVITLVESLVVIGLLGRGARRARRAVVRVDLAFAIGVLVVQPLFVGQFQLIGSWTAWGYAFSLTTVALAGAMLRWRELLVWVAVLTAAYVILFLPGAVTKPKSWSLGINAVAYLGFAVLAAFVAALLRRLGAAADSTVRSAAQLAAEEERDRARLLLHDHAALLSVVSQQVEDAALRDQANDAANEVVNFLTAPAGWEPVTQGSLADVVRRAARPFGDLPLTVTAELADGVRLPVEQERAVRGAVTTLLHNVRTHAHARSVVVHADAADDGEWWEVTVRDDGVGFDQVATPMGFGLGRQVLAAAARVGLQVDISTAPGCGTAVRILGGAPGARGR